MTPQVFDEDLSLLQGEVDCSIQPFITQPFAGTHWPGDK